MKKITILFLFIFSFTQSQDLTLSGGTLTIERTGSLTMTGNFANNSGTVTLNSDANEFAVIKVGGSATGNITYNRYVNAVGTNEWDLIGSPVDGLSINSFATTNTRDIWHEFDMAFSYFIGGENSYCEEDTSNF